jgi:hypothetical protein
MSLALCHTAYDLLNDSGVSMTARQADKQNCHRMLDKLTSPRNALAMPNSKPRTRERSMVLRDPDFLVNVMKHAEVSDSELAQFAGCSRQAVWQLRTGKRPGCTETTAKRIAARLKVDVGLLFLPRVSPTRSQTDNEKAS